MGWIELSTSIYGEHWVVARDLTPYGAMDVYLRWLAHELLDPGDVAVLLDVYNFTAGWYTEAEGDRDRLVAVEQLTVRRALAALQAVPFEQAHAALLSGASLFPLPPGFASPPPVLPSLWERVAQHAAMMGDWLGGRALHELLDVLYGTHAGLGPWVMETTPYARIADEEAGISQPLDVRVDACRAWTCPGCAASAAAQEQGLCDEALEPPHCTIHAPLPPDGLPVAASSTDGYACAATLWVVAGLPDDSSNGVVSQALYL